MEKIDLFVEDCRKDSNRAGIYLTGFGIEKEAINTTLTQIIKNSHAGILSQYAHPNLILLEDKAVEMAILEKYK